MSETNERLLAGRVALLTGSAQGLGRAIAHRFAAAGAIGIALDLDGAAAVAAAPTGWLGAAADVRDESICATRWPKLSSGSGASMWSLPMRAWFRTWAETEQIDLARLGRSLRRQCPGRHCDRQERRPGYEGKGRLDHLDGIAKLVARARPTVSLCREQTCRAGHRARDCARARSVCDQVNALAPGAIATDALLRARGKAG